MTERHRLPEVERREIIRGLLEPHPTIIGLEGGPSSGKTTLLKRLQDQPSERTVVCLPEVASEHILRLVDQGVDVNAIEYDDRPAYLELEQQIIVSLVDTIETARQRYARTDTIVIADRCDIGAYVSNDEYRRLLDDAGLAMPPLLSHIDRVFFLPSVATLAPDRYEALKATNPARLESTDRARQVCANNLAAVARHPELHVAWGGEFSATLDELVDTILDPDTEHELKLQPRNNRVVDVFCEAGVMIAAADIMQSYHELEGIVFRLRTTVTDHGETLYTFTVKQGEGLKRQEVQRIIDATTYRLLGTCRQVGLTLSKRRQHVVVDDPLETGRKRLWAVDSYARTGHYDVETDVRSTDEAHRLMACMPDFAPARHSAETLARRLGSQGLSQA